MRTHFSCAKISAIATCVPPQQVHLQDQADLFYQGDLKKVKRIKQTIGIDTRHIADQQTTTLDLCTQAARQLLYTIPTQQLDALIFVTQTPDYLQPNNAHLLHFSLDLDENCACFDLNGGCSGYVYGLFLAYNLIQSGAKNVLLCAGDTLSKILHPTDSNTTPLFGDAGSATLIAHAESSSFFSLHSDGKGWKNIIHPQSAFRDSSKLEKTSSNTSFLSMDGAEVFNFSIQREPQAIQEILDYAHSSIHHIDYIFFHQANAYIISNIARRLELPLSKAPFSSISKYGNTSSASIPLAICDLLHTQKRQALKVILSGFGVGLSWASALLDLTAQTLIFEPQIYKKEE